MGGQVAAGGGKRLTGAMAGTPLLKRTFIRNPLLRQIADFLNKHSPGALVASIPNAVGSPRSRLSVSEACYNRAVDIQSLHPWDVDPRTAAAIQRDLAARVIARDEVAPEPRFVAGVDLSPPDATGEATAAVVLLELPALSIVEVRLHRGRPAFPYVPGLLSFREAPLVLGALAMLSTTPDVILVDGQGMAHPRRFGLACHLGLLNGVPTIGCAKSILCGRPDGSPKPERGSHVPLVDHGEVVGAAVRTRTNVSPIYVSVGHRTSLERAVELTLACCKGYRMPEPTRLAHLAAAGRIAPVGAGA